MLATDTRGRPALLLRSTGPAGRQGSVVLCTYPTEHMAALTPRVSPDDTVRLYDTLIRDDGTLFTVLARHALEPLTVKPALDGGELVTLDGQEAGEGVTLDPFGIKVLRITWTGQEPWGPGNGLRDDGHQLACTYR